MSVEEDLWTAIERGGPRVKGRGEPSYVKNRAAWEAYYNLKIEDIKRRHAFLATYAFAIPTPEAIEAIREHVGDRKLLELGAGSGLWARLLCAAGVFVTATDDGSWGSRGGKADEDRHVIPIGRYFLVERYDGVEAVHRYPDHRALFLCWPPYDKPMATAALRAFTGDRLVYIGEDDSGCTGDEALHELRRGDEWEEVAELAIPQWWGIHDRLWLYSRRSELAANSI